MVTPNDESVTQDDQPCHSDSTTRHEISMSVTWRDVALSWHHTALASEGLVDCAFSSKDAGMTTDHGTARHACILTTLPKDSRSPCVGATSDKSGGGGCGLVGIGRRFPKCHHARLFFCITSHQRAMQQPTTTIHAGGE